MIEIERSQYLYQQYGRRESVKITGIPPNIGVRKNDVLETALINVYNKAGVKVHGKELPQTELEKQVSQL